MSTSTSTVTATGEHAAIVMTERGMYCPAADIYIDPWEPVPTAVITHAHADHARPGCDRYICAAPGAAILRLRMGEEAAIRAVDYGEAFDLGSARLSLHPAGHVLGSAQVRIDTGAHVTVVSGDYKRDPDPTCAPFEVVPCDTFLTEATFALPIYRWPDATQVAAEIAAWWQDCAEAGRPALLGVYACGKAQRVLAELGRLRNQPIWVHGAIETMTQAYREAGVAMAETLPTASAQEGSKKRKKRDWAGELILAPPSAIGSRWARTFANAEIALASGWMRVRGNRRWQSYDRGFVLSDHADWPALLATIRETGARHVICTHGTGDVLARYLREELGLSAVAIQTRFEGEGEH